MDKTALREEYLRIRRGLHFSEVLEKSGQISDLLLKLPIFDNVRIVAAYIPVNNEVETKKIIDFLIGEGLKVCVPQFTNNEYRFCRFDSWDDLSEGPFKIMQPIAQEVVSARTLDIAILPGIAFDLSRVRLGYGKGIFDQMLAGSKAYKIGLTYDFQIVNKLPREKHDLVMDLVVTEKRLIDNDSIGE